MDVLRDQFIHLLQAGANKVAMDLSDVSLVDSLGLAMLIGLSQKLRERGGRLVLENVQPDVYNLLAGMRLLNHLTVGDSSGDV